MLDAHTHCTCNCVLLCWRCHFEVHANPVAAKKAGWIVSRFFAYPSQIVMTAKRRPASIRWQHDCTGNIVGAATFND